MSCDPLFWSCDILSWSCDGSAALDGLEPAFSEVGRDTPTGVGEM